MRKWTIWPLDLGTLHRKRSNFLYMEQNDAPIDVPVLAFLLQSEDHYVLVDTGCDKPEHTMSCHRPFDKTPNQQLSAALSAHGVSPKDIELVILTHLHWDHVYGIKYLPNARFLTQHEELRYAVAPLPFHAQAYESRAYGMDPPWAAVPIEPIDGDIELVEGIMVLWLPGHTPGSQSVLVESPSGKCLIAGDNVPLMENWHGRPPFWPHIPDTHHYDLSAYYHSWRRMEKLGARIIPSHDPAVLDSINY